MAHAARLNLRMQKELKLLLTDPPPGVSLPAISDNVASSIDACIQGPEGTVYEKGIFRVKIQIPDRYPFQPPHVTIATPVYHPNIDTGGRICLDILNLPPKGAWQPSLNISTVLTSIGLLLSEPNPDDGLMCEASREYKYDRRAFDQKARSWTERYARPGVDGSTSRRDDSPCTNKGETESIGVNAENIANVGEGSHKRHCGVNRKLSLGSRSSLDRYDGEGNENKRPASRLSLSGLQNDLEKQFPLPEATRICEKDSYHDHDENNMLPCEQQSLVASTVIVSDSEGSEDECSQPRRSRLSLRRNRFRGRLMPNESN